MIIQKYKARFRKITKREDMLKLMMDIEKSINRIAGYRTNSSTVALFDLHQDIEQKYYDE